ncbi:MAG: hypothetical protein D4S02_16365 [Rhodocyclaceae bacterium]|nr:MAG: hypothetical protein D4S02_16365 [Rhodocyclaceae bacterium]
MSFSRTATPAFKAALDRIIDAPNRKAHDKRGSQVRDCSQATRDDRRAKIHMFFADLRDMGYRLTDPRSLRQKHVKALTEFWNQKGLAPRTIHTWLSMLRVFCTWIGKPNLVGDTEDYFEPGRVHRHLVATENKCWDAHGIDPLLIILKATALDERFGLYLSLDHHVGTRGKEAMELRPLQDYDPATRTLTISRGTKGGKARAVPLETPEQFETIEWARRVALAAGGRIRWPGTTWKQAQQRFFHFARKLGITKKDLGVTAHGLRHGFLQRVYTKDTGLPPPIAGGALGKIDAQTHWRAMEHVSSVAGHGRRDAACFYAGGYGHSLRGAKTPADLLGPEHTSVAFLNGAVVNTVPTAPSSPTHQCCETKDADGGLSGDPA